MREECLCPVLQCPDHSLTPHLAYLLMGPSVTCGNTLSYGIYPNSSAPCTGHPAYHSTSSPLGSAAASPAQCPSLPVRNPKPQHPVCPPSQVGTGQSGHSCSAALGHPGTLVTPAALITFSSSLLLRLSCMLMVQVWSPLDCSGIFLVSQPVCPVD